MTIDTEKRLAEIRDHVNRLVTIGMVYPHHSGLMAATVELITRQNAEVDRLTAERDAAWVTGATEMQEKCLWAIRGLHSGDGTAATFMSGALRVIRALSPSTLNKPE